MTIQCPALTESIVFFTIFFTYKPHNIAGLYVHALHFRGEAFPWVETKAVNREDKRSRR